MWPEAGLFQCDACLQFQELDSISRCAPEPCGCLLCQPCIQQHVVDSLKERCGALASPKPRQQPGFTKGDPVWYITAKGARHPAQLIRIDVSLHPPAYSVLLQGHQEARETEGSRLMEMTEAEQQQCCEGKLAVDEQPLFKVSERVWYLTADMQRCMATVKSIDTCLEPPAVCVQLEGQPNVRETELHRLRPLPSPAARTWKAAAAYAGIPCPVNLCEGQLPERDVQAVAPKEYEEWNLAATQAAMAANGIIRCPNPACGALVERVPAPQQPHEHSAPQASTPAPGAGTADHEHQHQERGHDLGQLGSQALHRLSSWVGKLKRRRRSSDTERQRPPVHPPAHDPAPPPVTQAGWQPSPAVTEHKAQHRYRCAACKLDFCDECRACPYHEGYTCEEHRAPRCPYCNEPNMSPLHLPAVLNRLSVKQLRELLKHLRTDMHWCVEKDDLLRLAGHAASICADPACRAKLAEACTQMLPCGHRCGGVRGEAPCLPCLEGCLSPSSAGCSHAPLGRDDACQMCYESLRSGPTILLRCGHACHLDCAREQLHQGYPGPAISFTFLQCAKCGSSATAGYLQQASAVPTMDHPALAASLKRPLQLRDQVVQRAKQRLKLDGLLSSEPALQPGGQFDGQPADFALTKYMFYECAKCQLPYYGGERQCGPAEEPAGGGGGYNKEELVCGSCSALQHGAACPRHGSELVEWKCQYCCSVAAWFCFGNTHMCEPCHVATVRGRLAWQANSCRGAASCPLKVTHPPRGNEFCLGCALCRYSKT